MGVGSSCSSAPGYLECFVFFIHFRNLGKISVQSFKIFSDSFVLKNGIIHAFSLFWSQILNFPALFQHNNIRLGPIPWKRSVLQIPTDKEPIRALRFAWLWHIIKTHNYLVSWFSSPVTLRFSIDERR